jgi:hypothetical protein
MFTLEVPKACFIRLRAGGVLNMADYAELERDLQCILDKSNAPMALLLDLRNFLGWTPSGFIRDLVFDFRHRKTFSRIAVIGDRHWHKWSAYAAAPLFKARTKFFWPGEEAIAEAWVSQVR